MSLRLRVSSVESDNGEGDIVATRGGDKCPAVGYWMRDMLSLVQSPSISANIFVAQVALAALIRMCLLMLRVVC